MEQVSRTVTVGVGTAIRDGSCEGCHGLGNVYLLRFQGGGLQVRVCKPCMEALRAAVDRIEAQVQPTSKPKKGA